MIASKLDKLIQIDCPNCWHPINATRREILEDPLSCKFCSCGLPDRSLEFISDIITQPDAEKRLDDLLRKRAATEMLAPPLTGPFVPLGKIDGEDYESVRCPDAVDEQIFAKIQVGKTEDTDPEVDRHHPLHVKARALLSEGNLKYAELVARELVKNYPREARAHIMLANVLEAKGDASESGRHLHSAWKNVDQPGFLLARIGRQAWQGEQKGEAIVWWSKACAVQAAAKLRGDPFPLTVLEMICSAMGDQHAAEIFGSRADVAFVMTGGSADFEEADYRLAHHVGDWAGNQETKASPQEIWAKYVYAALHLLKTHRGREDYQHRRVMRLTDGFWWDGYEVSRGERASWFAIKN